MNKNSFIPLPPFKGWVLQNFPFIEEDFDAITSYQLWCKVVAYLNNTNNNVNVLAKEVLDIKNYFDNLDIQEEIDNKLDEMAESGQLTDIIAQYLQLAGILAFNTLDDLKGAENLSDGSFTKIYGKVTYNDGYGAFYKIRTLINTDVIDNDNLVALTNYPTLVAEKIKDSIVDKLDLTEMVVFGDSWSSSTRPQNVWVSNVASSTNLHANNYSVSGAGFVYTDSESTPIADQITEFINSDIVKYKVKYIILFGGINDYRHNVTENDLFVAISTQVNRLKTVCPQAKIVYISNCQYPYTMEQSYYWQQLHNHLSTNIFITTYNLDGTIGLSLYEDNLFHLDIYGQGWLSRNILAILNGGEIFNYEDVRTFEDEYVKLRVSATRLKTMIYFSIKFKVKQSFESHTISYGNVPNLPWANSTEVTGAVGDNMFLYIYALRNSNTVIAAGSNIPEKTYETNIIIPIVDNVGL